GNTITLTSKSSVTISNARVKDGKTLILGGLIRETSASSWDKIPFLSDLPIAGALFRASASNAKTRTELVIMVTPRIIKEEGVPYFRKQWREQSAYGNHKNDSSDYSDSELNPIVPAGNKPDASNPLGGLKPLQNKGQGQSKEAFKSTSNSKAGSNNITSPRTALPLFSEVLK
ncbi:MAG: hypothetical protein KC462_08245, partial [Cyanobacteria bacterium HKST-UBA05]|nr:hypothetical protein [Cyanobacteria bacterium HKST-UBA05]